MSREKGNSFNFVVVKQACFAGCMQTLTNATAPIGQIPFSNIAVTFEPMLEFDILLDIECLKPMRQSHFNYLKHHLYPSGRHKDGFTKGDRLNQLINYNGVCRAAPGLNPVMTT